MRMWIGRIIAGLFFVFLVGVTILALVHPPRKGDECLRPDRRCVYIDRGTQVAIIVTASILGLTLAGTGIATARRRRSLWPPRANAATSAGGRPARQD